MAAALFAASCGSDESGSSTSAPDSSDPLDTSPTTGGAAAAELREGSVELLEELRCTDTSVGAFPRTVVHDGGETEIDAAPERVVSIEGTTSLDMLLLMGVTPAAAGADYQEPFRVAPWQAVLTTGDRAAPGFDLIAKRPEVNIEQIAGARPDLVISQSGWIEDIIEPVADIGAPIVVFDWTDEKTDWRDNVRIVAESVGRDACITEIVTKVEEKIAETRAALEESGVADESFTVVTNGDGYLAYHGALDTIGKALVEDLGLELVPADGSQTEFAVETAESVLTGDNILAFDFEGFPFVDSFLEQPTVRGVADRFTIMPQPISDAGYYPSALGYYLWLDWFADTFGPDGDATDGAGEDAAGAATRTVEGMDGPVEVPAEPERIVALQDQNAMLPLLELGVVPVASAGDTLDDGTGYFRRVDEFDTSEVTWIGSFREPNLEAIADQRPDLIVSDSFAGVELLEELQEIAPLVRIDPFGQPLVDALMSWAELVDRTEEAEELRATYEERVDEVIDSIGDPSEVSVAVISGYEGGARFYYEDGAQATAQVVDDLGVARPEPWVLDGDFSIEEFPDHVADFVVVYDFGGAEDPDAEIDALVSSPLFLAHPAVAAGQWARVDATQTVGSGWSKLQNLLDVLEPLLSDPELDRDIDP